LFSRFIIRHNINILYKNIIKRYKNYIEEEMHFFTGKIEKFEESKEKEDDYCRGEKLMPIKKQLK